MKVSIDGDLISISGAGVEELKLRPGQYKFRASKDGKSIRQELVTITRGGRKIVSVSVERSDSRLSRKPFNREQAIAPFTSEEARRLQDEWAQHVGVPVEFTNSIGMTFRVIPPGRFAMGSTDAEVETVLQDLKSLFPELLKMPELIDKLHSESPRHEVTITRPFAMGAHEVTRSQFQRFVESTRYVTDAELSEKGAYGLVNGKAGFDPKIVWNANLKLDAELIDAHPVTVVSWNDAEAFCQWLSQREGIEYAIPHRGTVGVRVPGGHNGALLRR